MVNVVSRVKFALRFGGDVLDSDGPWTYFDDVIGCIEDWSGLLSEGPVAGDIIEQDWVDGAQWQKGKRKTYSFDVPFTALVPKGTVEPNIWESWSSNAKLIPFQGPQLTMRREFVNQSGTTARVDQAVGVLATDLGATVGIGRVIHTVAVFQNLTGSWVVPLAKASDFTESFDSLSTSKWIVPAGASALYGQLAMGWGGTLAETQHLVSKDTFSLTNSSVTIEAVSLGSARYSNVMFHPLGLWSADLKKSVTFVAKGDASGKGVIYPYSSATNVVTAEEMYWNPDFRWLRIRESGGTIYWEMSANRTSWLAYYSIATSALGGWDPKKIRIGIYSTTNIGTGISTGRVCNFDNLNMMGGTVPTASHFSDNFASGAIDTKKWTTFGTGIAVTGGVCTFTWDGSTTGSQYVFSKHVFDLTNADVKMRLRYVNPTAISGGTIFYSPLRLWDESLLTAVDFLVQFDTALRLQANATTEEGYGGTGGFATYSSTNHAWLRLSESNGTIYWHTSTNGITWTQFGYTDLYGGYLSGWNPERVRIGFQRTQAFLSGAAVKIMEVDNFNTLT